MHKTIIMKFGGTSVGSAERILNVASLILAQPHRKVVVVSAMHGVTDMLINASHLIREQKASDLHQLLATIRQRHLYTAKELNLNRAQYTFLEAALQEKLSQLEMLICQLLASGCCTEADYDRLVAYGEILCIQLVSAAIVSKGGEATPIEATSLIITSDNHCDAEPILEDSVTPASSRLCPIIDQGVIPVVTGFIGATSSGAITTLGRGASDYTATVLAYCLDADEVWIWTDVTGVKTADPRIVPEAKTIDNLSYKEAAELSYFGAKVLHPLTMIPASLKDIPIYIKNTFEPKASGTKITANANTGGVKAITVKSGLSLATIHGKGMVGVPRVTAKVMEALANSRIDVFMILQASAEQSISFVVSGNMAARAIEQVHSNLSGDLVLKQIREIRLKNNISVVAVVGRGVQSTPGIIERTFSTLEALGVEVIMMAHGSSQYGVSFAVDTDKTALILKGLHQSFELIG